MEFLGAEAAADHLDFIVEKGVERPVINAILDVLWRNRVRWDVLSFSGIPEESDTPEILRERQWPWQALPEEVCPRVLLPADWDTYFMSLSRRKRKEQRRFRRQLDERFPGAWRWKQVQDPEGVRETLDALIAFHQAKWEALDKPGAFASSTAVAFHHALAQAFLSRGWLRLFRLDIEGRTVAALYTLAYRGCVYDFVSGFDFDFADYSPGQVLTEISLQEAINAGYRCYDFLRGDEQYKFRWGAEAVHDVGLRWIASPHARLAHGAEGLARKVWHGVKRLLPGALRQRIRATLRRSSD
ncbi:MAG: hypothetical protein Kow0077_15940 [Anaerolineae bacterium]